MYIIDHSVIHFWLILVAVLGQWQVLLHPGLITSCSWMKIILRSYYQPKKNCFGTVDADESFTELSRLIEIFTGEYFDDLCSLAENKWKIPF